MMKKIYVMCDMKFCDQLNLTSGENNTNGEGACPGRAVRKLGNIERLPVGCSMQQYCTFLERESDNQRDQHIEHPPTCTPGHWPRCQLHLRPPPPNRPPRPYQHTCAAEHAARRRARMHAWRWCTFREDRSALLAPTLLYQSHQHQHNAGAAMVAHNEHPSVGSPTRLPTNQAACRRCPGSACCGQQQCELYSTGSSPSAR